MAERRMFAITIIDSDAFIDMPTSARLLYYDLSMRADDEGFVNSPKKIMRMTGASEDDLRILAIRKFIIPFESGIVVIKHWKIHNYIRGDRIHETKYIDEKSMLITDEKGSYTLCQSDVRQLSDKVDTEVRLGKDRLGKDSKDKGVSRFTPPTYEEVKEYCDERNNNIDPQRFIDFYESKGWLVGKTKMKDWKACVRTWEARSDSKKTEEDVLPTYDTSKNKKISDEEIEELLSLRGK